MLESVLAGLAVAAISRMGRQLETTARQMKGKAAAEESRVAALLSDMTLSDSPLRAHLDIPEGVSMASIDQFVQKPQAEGIAFEALTILLTAAPKESLRRVESQWVVAITESRVTTDTKFARKLFRVVVERYKIVAKVIESQYPSVFERLRQEAHNSRLTCILESIDRRVDGRLPTANVDAVDKFVDTYRSQLQQAHSHITPPDFDRRRTVPIEELYVGPTFSDSARNDESTLGIDDLSTNVDRTVLLGNPGNGKSTASQVLLYRLSQKPSAPVPFLVTLRQFAAPAIHSSIVEHIERRMKTFYQCEAPPGAIEHLLVTGKALVIFDGLDELLDTSHRREVTDTVGLFCNLYPLTRVLVTSRKVGYDQAPMDPRQFRVLHLSGFNDEQVRAYVDKWFSQEELSAEEKAKWTSSFLHESDSVPDLRATPLLLALMCIIYRGERSIPKNRPAVYERCATMLFDKWDNSRDINSELRVGQLVDPAMKHLAYWLLTSEDAGEGVTESALIKETAAYLHDRSFENTTDAEAAAQVFVEFCRGRAWVFTDVGSTSDGERLYTFTHRTFLEYFAAYHLSRTTDSPENLAKTIASRVSNSEWDIVAQLAVQITDKHADRGAIRIFEYLLNEKRNRAVHKREAILSFLGRCLTFVQVSPGVLRLLTQKVVSNVFETARTQTRVDGIALGILLTNADYVDISVVRDELRQRITKMIESSDREERLHGLSIATVGVIFMRRTREGASEASIEQWRNYFSGIAAGYRDVYVRVSAENQWIAIYCVRQGWLSIRELVANEAYGGLTSIFVELPAPVFRVAHVGLVHSWLGATLGVYENASDEFLAGVKRQLSEVAELVRERVSEFPLKDDSRLLPIARFLGFDVEQRRAEPMELDADQLFALGFILCCIDEKEPRVIQTLKTEWGALEPIVRLIRARHTYSPGQKVDAQIPGFDLLTQWVRGDVQFLSIPSKSGS